MDVHNDIEEVEEMKSGMLCTGKRMRTPLCRAKQLASVQGAGAPHGTVRKWRTTYMDARRVPSTATKTQCPCFAAHYQRGLHT